jgi:hypothetical protein
VSTGLADPVSSTSRGRGWPCRPNRRAPEWFTWAWASAYTPPMSDQAPTVLAEQTRFVRAIPALAVSDVPRAVAFFAEVLGFDDVLAQADYGIARRDAVEVHFWVATGPEGSGAESRLAGTTSCRVQVDGIAALYEHCQARQVVTRTAACASSLGAHGSSPSSTPIATP